jgi:protein TonB
VVTRIALARDGRLIDAAVSRSSGFANLDRSVIDTIRRASPFPPFPRFVTKDRVRENFLRPAAGS